MMNTLMPKPTDNPTPTLRADGRWTLALPRKNGESRRYIYGKTRELCLDNYAKALGAGTVKVRPGSISEFIVTTFTKFIAASVQAESVDRYDSTWRLHLGPVIGHYRFSELTFAIVTDQFQKLDGHKRTSARSLFIQIVKTAIAHGEATHELLIIAQSVRVPKRKPKARRDVVEHAKALLRRAQGSHMEGFIFTAITLGLRKGELCGLQLRDLSDNTITLRRQRNHRVGEKGRLKHRDEGEERVIGVPAEVIARIRGFHTGSSTYLFTDEKGRPLQYQHVDRELAPFQGEGEARLTPHDLRAAAIGIMIEAGIHDHTIMDIMGHGSANMLRVYRDDSEQRTREAIERLKSV